MLARMPEGTPSDPNEVWDMIRRADDLVKYAPNRDPSAARAQARQQLGRAAEAAAALPDRSAGEALAAQVRTRLEDLDRAEA
jgi:hypothetical protein